MGLLHLTGFRLLTREARSGAEGEILEERELLTGLLLSVIASACSPLQPGATCPGVPLPTMDRAASPHQLSIKKMLHG